LIVGGLTLRFWYSYQQEGAECYLYDLAILAEYRRRGIASALVRSAIECATARGAIAMWVQAEADDHNAVAFYRTLKQSEMNVSHFELL
jgi:aminoglycoside 3-N-acetyltransferase I